MAINKRKILESARKLAQKGAKDKALKEYQKLLKLDPKDAKLRLEIGDAYRRWGQVEEAIDTYTRVAEQYMAEGFDARAVAVYKQIVNLDPDCLDAYTPLAELYERMGLTAEAIASLQTAADGFHRQGKKTEALGLLRKMANADPTNTTSRTKVADLLRQEGMIEEAITEYALAAEELERQGEAETVGKLHRRILELDEKNVGALDALARNLAGRGKVAESLPLAERALALDPSDPDRYETLAGLYQQVGREEDRAGTYRKLSNLYRERGDEDTARNILQRYVPSEELSSQPAAEAGEDELAADVDLDQSSSDLFGEGLPTIDTDEEPVLDFGNEERLDVAPLSGKLPLDFEDEDSELEDGVELELDDAVAEQESPQEQEAISLDQPVGESAVSQMEAAGVELLDVEQLLAEASVYLRYGKRDRAVAHLERVLESDPDHRSALEKLGDVFAEAGESERAVEVWLRAAKRASDEDDEDGLRVLKSRIAALDPMAAANILPGEALPPDGSEPALEEGLDEVDLDLGAFEDDLALEGEDEELLDDDEILDTESDLSTGEESLEVDEAFGLEAETPETDASQSASLSASSAQQVQEGLEEADFYVDQGLLDEAEEIYQRVLAVAPNHPRALLRLGELTAARGGDPAAAAIDAEGQNTTLDSETIPDELGTGSDEPLEDSSSEEQSPEEWAAEAEEAEFSIEVPAEDESELVAEDVGELSDLDLDPDAPAEATGEAEPEGSDTEEIEVGGAMADGDFDLAAALADAFDDDEPDPGSSGPISSDADGFDAVFGAFKKGVSETLGEGDHQAHYDLAIAYKEMGLHDDAIAELEISMADESRKAECLHLIALCALDADRAPTAVETLERLLGLPDLPAEVSLAGRFDLGRALAGVGDRDAARETWSQVAAARPGFQDVESLLAELDAPEPEEADEAEDAAEEFESFEDVMEAVFENDEPEAPEPAAEAATPESEPAPETDPPPGGRKKRKKISFV